MSVLHFRTALTPGGWRDGLRVSVRDGMIAALAADRAPQAGDDCRGIGLPGMASLHSHAFQRALAGLTEVRGFGEDSFWSWRDVMYRFALSMTPDDVEAVAAQLYAEMLEAGFTRVGEFHYLHHDAAGKSYAAPAEMAGRIASAAAQTGIALTLLPVYYAHSSFGAAEPHAGQRRFICSIDQYAALLEDCRRLILPLAGANLGIAPHSLRAVTPEELAHLVALGDDGPIHMHIAEQQREVDDCLAWSGARPVEWLLDRVDVNQRWCLVHATHLSGSEASRLAASGAVAGLCPLTEANLGDGIFDGPAFLAAQGRYGIGSDGNSLIGVAEELRQLEYSQRLARQARNVMAERGRSTGRSLFDAALAGGTQALGQTSAGIAAGAPADIVALRAEHSAFIARQGDALLDSWIFGGGSGLVEAVWTHGVKRVEAGRHLQREEIAQRFARTLTRLLA